MTSEDKDVGYYFQPKGSSFLSAVSLLFLFTDLKTGQTENPVNRRNVKFLNT